MLTFFFCKKISINLLYYLKYNNRLGIIFNFKIKINLTELSLNSIKYTSYIDNNIINTFSSIYNKHAFNICYDHCFNLCLSFYLLLYIYRVETIQIICFK